MSDFVNEKKPLNGFTVIDLTTCLAGPACGRILAHMGADVIKVESLDGDPYRGQGVLYEIPVTATNNPLFVAANDGKRFISINLKNAEGLQVFYKLVARADVLITNLTERSLKKLRVTYEDLKPLNTRLVYGVISGYGEKGPDAGRPGYDPTAYFARGGYMLDYVQKGNPPNNMVLGAGDCNTGISLAAGVMGALIGAQIHGQGYKVCASLLHSSIWMASMDYVISQYSEDYFIDRVYRCKDGVYMYAQAITDKQKESLCEIIGLSPDVYNDRRNVVPALQEIYTTKTYEEWVSIFAETNICMERLNHIKEVAQDKQAYENGFLVSYYGDNNKPIGIPMPPIKYRGTSEKLNDDIRLGGSTTAVLQELGYSSEEIEHLAGIKAISIR